MPLAIIEKSPDSTLPYIIDWTAWLSNGDTLSSVTWDVPTGLVNEAESNTSTRASITLSGGVAGSTYDVKCTILTTGGLIEARTLKFMVVER